MRLPRFAFSKSRNDKGIIAKKRLWAEMDEITSLAQDKLEPVRNDKKLERFDVFQDVEKVFIGSF